MTNVAVSIGNELRVRALLSCVLVHMLMMTDVLPGSRVGFMLAVRSRAGPGELDRQEDG